MTIKKEYSDSILFFRLGDFYEMFFDDALIASKELEITLTQRDAGMENKAPMCGVPHHVADGYVSRLVEKGYKVAICDQVEDPRLAKGIVKREVIRVVTPGTITDNTVLDEKSNNFLASIYINDIGLGISYVDNSTGEIYTTEFIGPSSETHSFLIDELGKIYPSEIICNEELTFNSLLFKTIKNTINPYINVLGKDKYDDINDNRLLLDHFNKRSLKDLKLQDKYLATLASSKLIEYLYLTQKSSLVHVNNLTYYEAKKYMIIDINTRINLEIHETIMRKDRKGALIGLVDETSTSMGARLLKKWLDQPLIDIKDIEYRHNIVEYFLDNIQTMDEVTMLLKKIYDIERLSGKISSP